jgi:chromate transporter
MTKLNYKNKKLKLHLQLFLSTLYLSSVTFGGGYVIISFMKKIFVEKHNWLTEDEMIDITTIAQSSPGSIAINASVLVGYKMAGITGAFVTVLGTVLPPLFIISFISIIYSKFSQNENVKFVLKGMNAGVSAVIIDVSTSMFKKIKKSFSSYIILFFSFLSVFLLNIDVKIIILATIILGLIRFFIHKNKKKEHQE